jgi:glycosyltransferase involved in cell wall biosynthesis
VNSSLKVVMTLAFYPRGGSAQVVRYLAGALVDRGDSVTVCCGSLGPPGASSHAGTFFGRLDVEALDFTEAVEWYEQGRDPMAAPVPIHPSFEDRPDVPDRVFATLDDDEYRHQVEAWRLLLERVGPPDLYHVHHLTHVNDAVLTFGDVPVVAHLHGTELKMLAEIQVARADSWPYASEWEERLIAAAQRASRLVVVSAADRVLASDVLGVDADSIEVMSNGVDLGLFSSDKLPPSERLAKWNEWLVEDPCGWDESGDPGTVRYSASEVQRGFVDAKTGDPLPVLLYVGRFLGFKRVPLLIKAYAEARGSLGAAAPPLVIWGGYPGEWEGEHPHTVATSLGVEGVFFAGWRGHDDLSVALNCADIFVAPSVDEPFGQVYLEAMASALPVIATRSGGPLSFVNTDPDRPNGWMVTPDDGESLAAAIVEAASSESERRSRGQHGRALIEREYDWKRIAEQVDAVYREVIAGTSQT